MKILLAEDNEDSRMMLKKLLESNGDTVTIASNGEEALMIAKKDPPDMIISDIMMPVMDGFRLCFEIKHDEDLKNIPFVFYTATYTDQRDERLAIALGASRFLIKPVEPDVFIKVAKEVMQEYKNQILPVPEEQSKDELQIYKMYVDTLVRKLHKKVKDLERETKAHLEAEEKLRIYQQQLEKMVSERTAQLETANRELEAFAYSVSHDLRAPLRAIEGYSRFVLEDYTEKLDDEGRRLLNVIRTNVEKMDHLITDLLGLSRVSRSEIRLTRINMNNLVSTVFQESFLPEVRNKFK